VDSPNTNLFCVCKCWVLFQYLNFACRNIILRDNNQDRSRDGTTVSSQSPCPGMSSQLLQLGTGRGENKLTIKAFQPDCNTPLLPGRVKLLPSHVKFRLQRFRQGACGTTASCFNPFIRLLSSARSSSELPAIRAWKFIQRSKMRAQVQKNNLIPCVLLL
jgi:hypothetical protein